jgi:putative addiction module killer protein
MEIRHYVSVSGHDIYQEWLDKLKDARGRVAVQRRVDRVIAGNFGDHKLCRDGVSELRIDVGPGYRVYYAQTDNIFVLLLCGGDKRSQQPDIKRAVEYLGDYQRRLP